MKEVIKDLFTDYGYSRLSPEFDLYSPLESEKKVYWLLVESSPKNVLEMQAELFEQCTGLGHHAAVNKNTNLICLWCVPVINSDVVSEVHAVEEDLFFFKKHVLYYTPSELNNLKARIGFESLGDILSVLINDPDTFSRYKEMIGLESWNELLYRIVIKLSFIDIGDGTPVDIEGLHSKHTQRVLGTRQPELLSFIESFVLNMDLTDSPVKTLADLVDAIAEAGYEVNYK